MKVYSHEYNSNVYDFTITMKAKVEIEEAVKKSSKIDNPELLKIAPRVSLLMEQIKIAQAQGDKEKEASIEKELEELLPLMAPFINEMNDMGEGISEFEVMYILLKNNSKNKGNLARELFDEVCADMEEKLGIEDYADVALDIYNKAFTLFAKMNEKKEQVKTKLFS